MKPSCYLWEIAASLQLLETKLRFGWLHQRLDDGVSALLTCESQSSLAESKPPVMTFCKTISVLKWMTEKYSVKILKPHFIEDFNIGIPTVKMRVTTCFNTRCCDIKGLWATCSNEKKKKGWKKNYFHNPKFHLLAATKPDTAKLQFQTWKECTVSLA